MQKSSLYAFWCEQVDAWKGFALAMTSILTTHLRSIREFDKIGCANAANSTLG